MNEYKCVSASALLYFIYTKWSFMSKTMRLLVDSDFHIRTERKKSHYNLTISFLLLLWFSFFLFITASHYINFYKYIFIICRSSCMDNNNIKMVKNVKILQQHSHHTSHTNFIIHFILPVKANIYGICLYLLFFLYVTVKKYNFL